MWITVSIFHHSFFICKSSGYLKMGMYIIVQCIKCYILSMAQCSWRALPLTMRLHYMSHTSIDSLREVRLKCYACQPSLSWQKLLEHGHSSRGMQRPAPFCAKTFTSVCYTNHRTIHLYPRFFPGQNASSLS